MTPYSLKLINKIRCHKYSWELLLFSFSWKQFTARSPLSTCHITYRFLRSSVWSVGLFPCLNSIVFWYTLQSTTFLKHGLGKSWTFSMQCVTLCCSLISWAVWVKHLQLSLDPLQTRTKSDFALFYSPQFGLFSVYYEAHIYIMF